MLGEAVCKKEDQWMDSSRSQFGIITSISCDGLFSTTWPKYNNIKITKFTRGMTFCMSAEDLLKYITDLKDLS